jgi:hypothetical protein
MFSFFYSLVSAIDKFDLLSFLDEYKLLTISADAIHLGNNHVTFPTSSNFDSPFLIIIYSVTTVLAYTISNGSHHRALHTLNPGLTIFAWRTIRVLVGESAIVGYDVIHHPSYSNPRTW